MSERSGAPHQVVIVGAGPVGLGLAVDLGLHGISCAVVERRTEVSRIPKGQFLTQRTLEHFHRWGLADELRAQRLMSDATAIGQVTAYRDLTSDFWRAPPGRELVHSYYFQKNERLPQYRTEDVLRRRLRTLDHVDQYLGWSATEIGQDADGVRVVVERDGERAVLEAAYLVGCDGGRSLVRDQSGIGRASTDFDEVMALIVFRSRELYDVLERFPERSTYRVLHPDLRGYWMFFGRIDVDGGWFFHAPLPNGVAPEDLDPVELLERAVGRELTCEIEHVGFWDLRVDVAETYRAGRVFIAGDAAHTHPPYGGFGLNNGLEDATNLAWKLRAVLEGWGGDGLLDSYGEERGPVFRDIGQNIIAAGIERDRRFLERYGPERDRAEFDRRFDELSSAEGSGVLSYEPNYEGSPVVVGAPGETSAHGTHSLVARAGHHLAPRSLSDGRDVFEALGTGFTLLTFGVPVCSSASFESAADELSIPLTVVRDDLDGGRDAYEARFVLVRPDQYVAWSDTDAPDDVTGLLRTVCAQR